jgi:integrase/recombinase XerD
LWTHWRSISRATGQFCCMAARRRSCSSGQALAEHTIRQAIIRRTQAALGVPINPHLFRDCAATTLAIEDPAHVGAAATILGHTSSHTTHKHYIQANTLAASRRHLDAVAARRRRAAKHRS